MAKFKENLRYFICVLLLLAVFAIYGLRLVDWQIVNGASSLQSANKTYTSAVTMDAARGEILDADGNGLAVNKIAYNIVFDKLSMTKGTENKTIFKLTQFLTKSGEPWVDELPITVNSKGQYAFVAGKEKEIAALKSRDFLGVNTYATADECMTALIARYECSSYSPADIRTIVSVRYNMEKSGFAVSTPYTFAENVSQKTIAIVSENSQLLPGATIKVTTIRQYNNPTIAPQIIGHVAAISQEEYAQAKKEGKLYSSNNISGYTLNDHIGKDGIEGAFEDQLRGKSGQKVVETTKAGALAATTKTKAPTFGDTVYLTLNSRLQAVANASLAKNIKGAQEYGKEQVALGHDKQGEDCVAGSVVVLNVKDFSVLAAATYPSYDLSQMDNAKYYLSIVNDKTTPLVNRAFNGAFMPGSAFKPVVASAALQEGKIDVNTIITCNHVYDRWTDYRPTCMHTHGPLNVLQALQKSCNIFFFETGFRLGIDNMDMYAKHFGLGVKTGIEINESSGTLAGPQERKAAGGVWQTNGGDVVQAAIGQSDNAFTPVQLATYAATIANNGVRLKTHIVSKITDYARKNIVMQNDVNKPTVVDNIGVSQANLNIVKQGMRLVCQSGGTAASVFEHYVVPIAAKTGTAQTTTHSDNVTFIGYAPYDKPEIAVAVVLEYGAKSKFSLNVAQDMFDAYFKGYTVDASGNIVDPSASSSSTGSAASSTISN